MFEKIFSGEMLTLVVAPTVTMFVTWFFARRKNRAETKNIEQQIQNTLLESYKDEIASLSERLNKYRQENQEKEMLYLEREAKAMDALRLANTKVDKLLLWFCCREHCSERVTDQLKIEN